MREKKTIELKKREEKERRGNEIEKESKKGQEGKKRRANQRICKSSFKNLDV